MKRTRKVKRKDHVSSSVAINKEDAGERGLKKLMAKSQRVLRAIDRARRGGDKAELKTLQSELKDVQKHLQGALGSFDTHDEVPAERPVIKTVDVEGERWVLTRDMHFGLVKAGFTKGMTFTVNREKGTMVCDDTGQTFTNIKDLEIAARVGVAQPLNAETETIVEEQQERKRRVVEEMTSKQKNIDEELRGRIISSDQDIIAPIPSPQRKRTATGGDAVRQLTTPTNIVSLIKPRHRQAQNIIVSDGVQQSTRVSADNENVIMGTKKKQFWDTKNSGQRMADVRKVVGNKRIERDDNGHLVVRGMGVVRDDSRVGSGPALNEGKTVSLSRDEIRERRAEARERAAERKSDVTAKRKKAGVQVREPVVSVADDDSDEAMMSQLVDETTPRPLEKPARGKVKQLLRRRY